MTEHGGDAGRRARLWLRRHHAGVLGTLSCRHGGHPYGSAVHFVADFRGRPVFLASALAEHTVNLEQDPRASLTVHDIAGPAGLTGSRATIMGVARRTTPTEGERARFLNHLPDARRWLELGDFGFFRLEVSEIRFIGGFGDVGWIGAHDYLVQAEQPSDWPGRLPVDLAGAIQHLMERRSPGSNDSDAPQARLLGVDADGFDVGHANACHRFDFTRPVRDFDGAVSEIRSLVGRNDHGTQEEHR